ncbi:hypothetical protein G6M89_12125 [Natronolimnobius sp. AArcel1]|uniref:hypothetical protein n=1 Tax=Natronolimnobius sp. AArcel1 TaxID=1679093 RepID=UPI0013ED0716|nr:hypothetical protein [Natronolimnobius sp. AArcel1]NGM69746.1 hypothetical protein [Natronolimnobius sp. AArcel1]
MNRRRLLFGSGALLALAGCVETLETDSTGTSPESEDNATDADETASDDEHEDDEHEVPPAARETGRDVLVVSLTGDTETALNYVPAAYFDSVDDAEWEELVEQSTPPEEVHAMTLENAISDDEFVADLEADDEFDGTATAAYVLEFEVDVEVDGERIDRPARVTVLEIDDEWYGWAEQFSTQRSEPQAAIDIDKSDDTTATLTLTSKPDDVVVGVRGGDIDDSAEYQFDAVGDSLTLETSDVGSGQFSVIGHYEDDEDHAAVVSTFTLTDPAAWADVTEITLEPQTAGWIGVEPTHIEGVENPDLVLEEGREYTIAQEGGDGAMHDLQLWDEDEAVVDDYATELIDDPDARQELSVTATEELAAYVCEPHEMTMRGEIEVVSEFDFDN